jgi:Uma2 family endonuclease
MSTTSTNPFMPSPFTPSAALPLKEGERINVTEFIRRWEALPAEWQAQHKRIELIQGVVRHMPPTSGGYHAEPHFNFISFLGMYRWATPGVIAGAPSSIILGEFHMPEPDAFMAIDPKYGGRIRHDEKGYVIGAPELLSEMSNSSVSTDLHTKKELYRKHGVNEYVVRRVKENAMDWFILRGDDYQLLATDDGIYRSETFPGLWLAAPALIAGDFSRVTQVLQQGLASPEHRAFVDQLAKQKSS